MIRIFKRILGSWLLAVLIGLGLSMQARTTLFSRHAPGGVFTIDDLVEHPGDIYYVNSATGTDAAGNGLSPDSPTATIDYAVGLCTADNGDVIYVMPGHVETVVAANGLDFDVAGIKVIGLGRGTKRPTINLTTLVTALVRINANNVVLENLLFTGGIDNITTVLKVNAVTDVVLRRIEYRDVTGQAAKFFHAVNDSDRILIEDLIVRADAAAGATNALTFDGCDELVLRNFDIKGNFSSSAIEFITTLSARVEIYNGYIWTQNSADLCIKDTITACTGRIGPGLYLMLTDNAANITEACTGATFHYFQDIAVVNLAGESSMLTNITASTDA